MVDSEKWGLAKVWDSVVVKDAFMRYKHDADLDFTPGIGAFIRANERKIGAMMDDLFGEALSTTTSSPEDVIDYVEPDKGSGFGCYGTKAGTIEKGLGLLKDMLDAPLDLRWIRYFFEVIGKDEVRLLEKEPRTFQNPTYFATCRGQQLFKKQNEQLLEFRFKIPFALGMSMPGDWHLVSDRFAPDGIPFTWDAPRWDASVKSEEHDNVMKLRLRHLKCDKYPGGREAAEIVASEFTRDESHSVCLLNDGMLILSDSGIKSGTIVTSTNNSLIHIQRILCCWMKSGRSLFNFKEFLRRSGLLVFGDDGIAVAVTPDDVGFFRALPEIWKTMFGRPLKINEHAGFSEAVFLGRRSAGDAIPERWNCVVGELDRDLASLYHKGRQDPVHALQAGVAHRILLGTAQKLPGYVEALDALDADLRDLVSEYFQGDSHPPDVASLIELATQPRWLLMMYGDTLYRSLVDGTFSYRDVMSLQSARAPKQFGAFKSTVAMTGILSMKAWKKKHESRLSGLSAKDVKKRYDDYVSSKKASEVNNARGNARKQQQKAYKQLKNSPVSVRSQQLHDNIQAYLAAVIDPLGSEGARQPSVSMFPSSTAYIDTPFKIVANSKGEFMMLIRDDIRRHTCDSWTDLDGIGNTGLVGSGTTTKWGMSAVPPVNTLNGGLDTRFIPCDKSTAIQTTYSAFRTVGLGVEIEYIGAPLDAKGQIVMGLWHPSEQFPHQGGNSTVTFEDLQETTFAQTCAAIDGGHCHTIPFGMDVTKFRRTWYKTNLSTVNGYAFSSRFSLSEAGPMWEPQYRNKESICAATGSVSSNYWVSLTSGGPTTQLYQMGDYSVMGDIDDTVTFPYQPMIYIAGEGLPPPADGEDGVVFRGRIRWLIECVADETTFHPGAMKPQMTVGGSRAQEAAMQVAAMIPPARPTSNKNAGLGGFLKSAATSMSDMLGNATGLTSVSGLANKLINNPSSIGFSDISNAVVNAATTAAEALAMV